MKVKILLFMILIILFTVIVSQNSEPVNLSLLFWGPYTVSAIILIAIAGLFGLILGFILSSIFESSNSKKAELKRLQKEEKLKKEEEERSKAKNNYPGEKQ